MSVKTLTRSFAAGEITPELYSRVDLIKNQTGLRTCRNFEVLPHGPVQNRAGFEYVNETKDSTKKSVLIPFIFSSTQNYALEFGDFYMRIHTLGATLLNASQAITGITRAAVGVLTYTGADPANGTWMYLSGIGGMTQLNGRFVKVANVNAGANTYELTDLAGNNINTTSYGAYTAGGTMASPFEIVTPYAHTDVADIHFTQSADVLTLVHPTYPVQEVKRFGALSWTITAPTFAPTQAAPTAPAVTPNGAGGVSYSYVITALAADGLEESLASTVGTNAACQDLTVAGAFNTVTWADAAAAVRYNVYKLSSGLYGYVGQALSGAPGFRDGNITPDMSRTPPENDTPFDSAGNYPGAVGYFSGRRWFGGTNNKQQNLWATRSGTESNMSYSIPTRDDDSIRVRLTSRQASRIRHIIPLPELILLTSGAEWKITALNSDAITPTSISYRPADYIGASNVSPLVTSGAVLYAQDRGGRVREMKASETDVNGTYRTADLSILAPHLFDDYTLVGSAWTRARVPIGWWPRSDGVMLGVTYVPEHQVAGWHHHDTDGTFESVASTPEGAEDALYAVIKRSINGRDVRYIERKHARTFTTLADCFFVDAGLTYNSTPATTISGLWHLVGETVSILADGAVQPQQVVTAAGAITLEQSASKVHIGLPYTCDFETLPLSTEALPAAGQTVMKNVNNAFIRVYRSSGVMIGPSLDKLVELKQRTTENYSAPPALITDEFKLGLTPTWQRDGSIAVRQSNPLPVTILSMAAEVAIGG